MLFEKGTYRKLTEEERSKYSTKYKYIILSAYRYESTGKVVVVPSLPVIVEDFDLGIARHFVLHASS